MTEVYVRHITKNGDVHKGHTADCAACRRAKVKKSEAQTLRENGRKGGLQWAKERAAAAPPPTCKHCSKVINKQNKSGLCVSCGNKERSRLHKAASLNSKNRHCANPECTNPIRDTNKTGLCVKCYRNSEIWNEYKKHHMKWLEASATKKPT